MSYLTATLTARCRELHFIEKIVKLPCTVKSLYFTMAEPKQRYLVPGYMFMLDVNFRHTRLAVVNILLLFSTFSSFPLVPLVPLWPIVAVEYV